ncbi:MAG: diguanylate cyclase [Nitrospirota bacterium]|nr:diguanylate cyclase [Nitrospirota bacterium]
MEIIDIDNVSSLQTHLSNLTGLSISIYGDKGNIIMPPVRENKLLSVIKASSRGRDEYNDFLKSSLEKTIHRRNISIFKGPAGQYHFFIPARFNNSVFIITDGGVYLSAEDFEDFYRREGQSYGLLPDQLKSWSREIIVRDYADIQNAAGHIQSIFNLFLRSGYEGSLNEKRYRLMKTIFSLISDIKLDEQAEEIHDILVDVLSFLFNADSVSIMIRDDSACSPLFRPRRAAGRLKEYLQSLPLKVTGIISEVIDKQKPIYSENVMEILRLGFSDEVTSIYAFPIISGDKITGLLGIFNSNIAQEDADIISDLCKITGFIFRLVGLEDIYDKRIKDIDVLNTAAERINPIKEPDMLYEAILDMSVHLAYAEKGSLMLLDEDTSYLTIKAAKGINKRLLGEIKIRVGEGIAGKVFREGVPLMVDDIERNEKVSLKKRPKYRTGSFISIPLKIGEETIGVLNISDKITGEVFSAEDLVLLRSFASYASIALERTMYYSLAGQLRGLSITDFLTDLFNRRYFEERFFEELQRSERYNLSFSLVIMDIDDFKLFNDTEGHLAGDEVLKSIANIAKDSLRVIDVIARFGGEEFAVIMPQTEKDEAFLVAERIRKSVKEQLPRTWKIFPRDNITTSIGIATFPHDGKDRKELIRNADKALYRGKMDGKDKTVLWGR